MGSGRGILSAFGVAVGATAFTLSGCANAQQQVAGHRYSVPHANLIPKSDYPIFLPKSEARVSSSSSTLKRDHASRELFWFKTERVFADEPMEAAMFPGLFAVRRRSSGRVRVGARQAMIHSGLTVQTRLRQPTLLSLAATRWRSRGTQASARRHSPWAI